jgi:cytochrome P450
MLMSARDEDGSRMTDRQLRDEVMTFLLAGHETTALSLSWTWYLLSENQAVEGKLHEELGRVLDGKNPSFEELPRLCYTEAVVKESMRLYPPAWSLARTAAKDFEVGGYSGRSECRYESVDHASRPAVLSLPRAIRPRALV